jgi:hypothetical protein
LDLFISLFLSVRRYRCGSMGCSWEGNLRERRQSQASQDGGEAYSGTRRLLEPARMGPIDRSGKQPR